MNNLREMLDDFRDYIYINKGHGVACIRNDYKLILRIFEEMANRIEIIEQRQKVEDEK